jgi:hypothetical protein
MTAKQDALIEVIDLIKRHNLSYAEVTAAMNDSPDFKAEKSSGVLSKVFGYIGGIFVFAGLAIFIEMQWNDLDSIGRIMVTLGPGFCAFILALVCLTNARFEAAATPLFLVAALVEPTGMVVALQEFSHGGEPMYGVSFICFIMMIQQGCTFWAKDRTVLALTTIIFGLGFFGSMMEIAHVGERLIGITLGASLTCIAWSLDHSRHKSIAALCYFFGSVLFLMSAYEWLRHSPAEILFLGLSCATIFLSTVARSRTLLLVGTLALIGYIGDYFAENFMNNGNAALGLVLAGFLLIGLGAAAVKINNKYIKQKA